MTMNDASVDVLDNELCQSVAAVRGQFLARIEPLRADLHRYCRRLTGNVWDAEDLVQETLAKAFVAAAQCHQQIERPLAWLLRIASNAYIDGLRRNLPQPTQLPEAAAPEMADPAEVREALGELASLLPPQERAALVLKDVFDLALADIAGMLNTSTGAVKSALHRGRGRLGDPDRQSSRAGRAEPDRSVVDALAEAFTAYDLDRLTELFLADGVTEVVGNVQEHGRQQARAGSLTHTLVVESDVRYRADVRELDGEPIVLLWARPVDGSADEAVEDLLRIDTADGGIRRLRWYYFCPHTLTEVTERLGLPVRTHGYHLG